MTHTSHYYRMTLPTPPYHNQYYHQYNPFPFYRLLPMSVLHQLPCSAASSRLLCHTKWRPRLTSPREEKRGTALLRTLSLQPIAAAGNLHNQWACLDVRATPPANEKTYRHAGTTMRKRTAAMLLLSQLFTTAYPQQKTLRREQSPIRVLKDFALGCTYLARYITRDNVIASPEAVRCCAISMVTWCSKRAAVG